MKYFFIGKTQDCVTYLIQIPSAFGIHFRLLTFKMIASINFDDQFFIDANEIRNIAKNRVLPTKVFAHTVPCEIIPKNRLCLSRIISHLPCLL